MEAKELRIGNYLKEEVLGDLCLIESVFKTGQVEISVSNISIKKQVNKRVFIFNINTFRPIPLTEEWLLKFGFEDGSNEVSGIYTEYSMETSKFEYFVYSGLGDGDSYGKKVDIQLCPPITELIFRFNRRGTRN